MYSVYVRLCLYTYYMLCVFCVFYQRVNAPHGEAQTVQFAHSAAHNYAVGANINQRAGRQKVKCDGVFCRFMQLCGRNMTRSIVIMCEYIQKHAQCKENVQETRCLYAAGIVRARLQDNGNSCIPFLLKISKPQCSRNAFVNTLISFDRKHADCRLFLSLSDSHSSRAMHTHKHDAKHTRI